MLVLPQNLMMREPDPASWENIGAENFNAREEDTFKQTTLHLSFTGSSFPLFEDGGTMYEHLVSLVESVVSVHDHGIWVGDVDILSTVEKIDRLSPQQPCGHQPEAVPAQGLISLESWDEILDPPRADSVVRASGNWPARLAASAALRHSLNGEKDGPFPLKTTIVVLPRSVCWTCLDPFLRQGQLTSTCRYFIY